MARGTDMVGEGGAHVAIVDDVATKSESWDVEEKVRSFWIDCSNCLGECDRCVFLECQSAGTRLIRFSQRISLVPVETLDPSSVNDVLLGFRCVGKSSSQRVSDITHSNVIHSCNS